MGPRKKAQTQSAMLQPHNENNVEWIRTFNDVIDDRSAHSFLLLHSIFLFV